jgi:hypothetical protein
MLYSTNSSLLAVVVVWEYSSKHGFVNFAAIIIKRSVLFFVNRFQFGMEDPHNRVAETLGLQHTKIYLMMSLGDPRYTPLLERGEGITVLATH